LLTIGIGKSATHFFRDGSFRVTISVAGFKTERNIEYGNFAVRAEKKIAITP